MLYIDGQPADVQLPSAIDVAVTETEPGLRGDTASGGGNKPAMVRNGRPRPGPAVHQHRRRGARGHAIWRVRQPRVARRECRSNADGEEDRAAPRGGRGRCTRAICSAGRSRRRFRATYPGFDARARARLVRDRQPELRRADLEARERLVAGADRAAGALDPARRACRRCCTPNELPGRAADSSGGRDRRGRRDRETILRRRRAANSSTESSGAVLRERAELELNALKCLHGWSIMDRMTATVAWPPRRRAHRDTDRESRAGSAPAWRVPVLALAAPRLLVLLAGVVGRCRRTRRPWVVFRSAPRHLELRRPWQRADSSVGALGLDSLPGDRRTRLRDPGEHRVLPAGAGVAAGGRRHRRVQRGRRNRDPGRLRWWSQPCCCTGSSTLKLGRQAADATVLLILFAPLSFFFSALYTESGPCAFGRRRVRGAV